MINQMVDDTVDGTSSLIPILNNLKYLVSFSGPAVLCPNNSSLRMIELYKCHELKQFPHLQSSVSSVLYQVPPDWKLSGDSKVISRYEPAVPPPNFEPQKYNYGNYQVDDPAKDHSKASVGENKRDRKCELCFKMVDKDLSEDHALVCSERVLECPCHCGESFPLSHYGKHMTKCKLNVGLCRYCDEVVQNTQMDFHIMRSHDFPNTDHAQSKQDCPNHPCQWYSETVESGPRSQHLEVCSSYHLLCHGCKEEFVCPKAYKKHQCPIQYEKAMLAEDRHPQFRDYIPQREEVDVIEAFGCCTFFRCHHCKEETKITTETSYHNRYHCKACGRPRCTRK